VWLFAGLLNSATQYDLYQMSRKNGYVGSFAQWGGYSGPVASSVPIAGVGNYSPAAPAGIPTNGQRGSVLCIKPGYDLGLEPSIAPSMNGLYNFQIIVNWWNNCYGWNQAAMVAGGGSMPAPGNVALNTRYTLYVVTVTSGLVTVKDNGTVTQTGLLTRADVLRAQAAPALDAGEANKMVGGDFFSKMKQFLGRGGRYHAYRSMLGGGSSEGPQPSPLSAPVPPSIGSGSSDPYTEAYYQQQQQQYKRKEMATPFDADPRERALAPHLRGRGFLQDPMLPPLSPPQSPIYSSPAQWPPSPERQDFYDDKHNSSSSSCGGGSGMMDDRYADEPDDRYRRDPPWHDPRSPEERYDSAMPDIPPQRVSRRRPGESLSLDENLDGDTTQGGPTSGFGSRRGHVFR
jgi:hypothetical protein